MEPSSQTVHNDNATNSMSMTTNTNIHEAVTDIALNRQWRLVSFLVSFSMLSFLIGQSFLTLRDQVGFDIPDIIIFPEFILGTGAIIWAGYLSVVYGVKTKRSIKMCLSILGLLTCWSLIQGNYSSIYAIREAFFSPQGIGVWIAFLLVLPGQNERFWDYFRNHLLTIYKISLILQIIAIALLFSENKGLLRVNFSTSISLFVFGWGLLAADKSYTRWGLIGLVLFTIHNLFINQRETFFLPIEFLVILLIICFARSLKQHSGKIICVLMVAYIAFGVFADTIVPEQYLYILNKTRIFEDTRTFVFQDYMDSDMTQPMNYLFGKGVNGFFESKFRYNDIGGFGTSLGIEMGYLQMLLNVGAIYVVLMIMISLTPAVKSVLKSLNPLVITAGIWVIVRLINMLFAAVPQTNFSWLLFWLCIGVLSSAEMTQNNLTED